jgi:hypothetical protein
MGHPLLTTIGKFLVSKMPNFILRRLNPTEKILGKISFSAPAEKPICYAPKHGLSASLQGIGMSIHSYLDSPINEGQFRGKLQHFRDVFARNLVFPLNVSIKPNCETKLKWDMDLSDTQVRIIQDRHAATIPLTLCGEFVVTAIGREFVIPVQLSLDCSINLSG